MKDGIGEAERKEAAPRMGSTDQQRLSVEMQFIDEKPQEWTSKTQTDSNTLSHWGSYYFN